MKSESRIIINFTIPNISYHLTQINQRFGLKIVSDIFKRIDVKLKYQKVLTN